MSWRTAEWGETWNFSSTPKTWPIKHAYNMSKIMLYPYIIQSIYVSVKNKQSFFIRVVHTASTGKELRKSPLHQVHVYRKYWLTSVYHIVRPCSVYYIVTPCRFFFRVLLARDICWMLNDTIEYAVSKYKVYCHSEKFCLGIIGTCPTRV